MNLDTYNCGPWAPSWKWGGRWGWAWGMGKGSQLCAGETVLGFETCGTWGPGEEVVVELRNLKLRLQRVQSYWSWQGLGWDSVTEVGWRTRSLAERVGNWVVTVLTGPVIKKDYGTILEGLRSKIFKKRKELPAGCMVCGWSWQGGAWGPLGRWPHGLSFRAGVWGAGLERKEDESS